MASMRPKFKGTLADLRQRLSFLEPHGEWKEISDNLRQFRHTNGAIINWSPSTGRITFQGAAVGKATLEKAVIEVVDVDNPGGAKNSSSEEPQAVSEACSDDQSKSVVSVKPVGDATEEFLGRSFAASELVIGLVSPVGTDLSIVVDRLRDQLIAFGYQVDEIRVSRQVIPLIFPDMPTSFANEYARISTLMDLGDLARKRTRDDSILALGTASIIAPQRPQDKSNPYLPKRAWIINSLKHPSEVARLREIYPEGFYLIGVHCDESRRVDYLVRNKHIPEDQARQLVERDNDEKLTYGQRTADTFHLSDFFVRLDENTDHLRAAIFRFLEILFGHPFRTPTFDEYAMFIAFSAALRSADLSRQVGAVIAKDNEILSTGANDCPKSGGGLHWPGSVEDEYRDVFGGRDHTRKVDTNKLEQQKIIKDVLDRIDALGKEQKVELTTLQKELIHAALKKSRISDLTEFGRMVHAEMEAILSCSRRGVSTRGADLYATTFPCHNCAKHIIAAGIERVFYIEPYPKSKAEEFHSDSIEIGFSKEEEEEANKVRFEPFVGVGPRRFFDLFSMSLSSGNKLVRKQEDGSAAPWNAKLRIQMLPLSYLQLEALACSKFLDSCKNMEGSNG